MVRLHPGWVTAPEGADDWTVRARAATGYTGGALSHASALRAHGLIDVSGPQVDITLPPQHGYGPIVGSASTAAAARAGS